MFNRNNGTDKQEILQNQFTAYVMRAIRNKRIRYITRMQKIINCECNITGLEPYIFDRHDSIQTVIAVEVLRQALETLQEKERQVILARVVEEKCVGEIAAQLGISYRAVTSYYYRGMKKLRDILLEGDDN